MRVEGIQPGLYRFLPVSNELLFVSEVENMEKRLAHACLGQSFVGRGAVAFIWATIPYRMEWRYSLAAHRVILIDAGHVCQNLYLACEAIEAGTCAVAAYDQEALDELLILDGIDEFSVYPGPCRENMRFAFIHQSALMALRFIDFKTSESRLATISLRRARGLPSIWA